MIGPKRVVVNEAWKTVELGRDMFLAYDRDLPIVEATGRDGSRWWLLGFAAQSEASRGNPADELERSTASEVPDETRSWAGRWLLIGDDRIVPDAASLLGCFYARNGDETWVSSSPVLLAEQVGATTPKVNEGAVREGRVDWYPPPATPHPRIRRLLPSQVLSLRDLSLCPRQLVPRWFRSLGEAELLDHLQRYLETAMQRACAEHRRVFVPLSAGYDSRLVLAAAQNVCERIETFTMRKKNEWRSLDERVPRTSFTSVADMRLPSKIAEVAGIPHQWIDKGELDATALAAFDQHSGGYTRENDRTYVAHGQWSWCEPGDLILRGGAFEVGHGFYYSRWPRATPEERVPEPEVLLEDFGIRETSPHARGIREWVAWTRENEEAGLDWRDRLYIEQRLGGWLASLEQALDLVGCERFYPVNSSWAYGVLLSLPEEVRLVLQHHTRLIDRLAPALAGIPFNPPDPPLRKLLFRVLRKARLTWHQIAP